MYLPRNIWFVLVVIMISSCSTETLDVTSPTGKLGVTVEPMEGKAYDKITFSVNYDGKTILSQTELGLETDVQKFYGNLKLKSVSKAKRIVDDYKMIPEKTFRIRGRIAASIFWLLAEYYMPYIHQRHILCLQ